MKNRITHYLKPFLLLLAALAVTTSAFALPTATPVRFNPGSGFIGPVDSFQWEDNTNVAIEQTVTVYDEDGNLKGTAATNGVTTLFEYFNDLEADFTKANNDQLVVVTHAQTRLQAAPSLTGAFFAAGFDANGLEDSTDSGWEVTMALSMTERATYTTETTTVVYDDGSGDATYNAYKDILTWNSVDSGAFKFYLDQDVDSNHITGEGFDDGTAFITGTILTVSGAYTTIFRDDDGMGGYVLHSSGGNVNVGNQIDSYVSSIITEYPNQLGVELVGTNFNTDLIFAGDPESDALFKEILTNGTATIGLVNPLTVTATNALLLQGQGTSDFTKDGTPIPEPATMVLFGLGLLGMAGVSRRKFL